MYFTPVWSPRLMNYGDALEKVQRCFTKCISDLHDLFDFSRMHALTLSRKRIFADIVLIYKCVHNFPAVKLRS